MFAGTLALLGKVFAVAVVPSTPLAAAKAIVMMAVGALL